MALTGHDNDNQNSKLNNHTGNAHAVGTQSENQGSENLASLPAPAFSIDTGDPNSPNSTSGIINNFNSDLQATTEGENETGETTETGTWTMPFDLGTMVTANDIKNNIWRLINNAHQVKNVFNNSKDIFGDLYDMDKDTEALGNIYSIIREKYDPDQEVEITEIEKLQATSNLFEQSFSTNFRIIQTKASGGLSKLQEFKRVNPETDEIKNALQAAYYDGDVGLAEKLTRMIDTVHSYNDTASDLLGLASENISYVDNSKVMDSMNNGSTKLKKTANKVQDMLKVAITLETIYDNIGGTGRNHLGGSAAGMGAIFDIMDSTFNFVDPKGQLVITCLWNDVYKPMIDFCITGMNAIESGMLDRGRDLTKLKIKKWDEKHIGEGNTAPTIIKDDLDRYFEGGWNVFNFMWNAMCGKKERLPNETVVEYFEANYDRVNTGAGSNDPLPFEGNIINWNIDPTTLMYWSISNKYKLWTMFYGTDLPIPPGTV